MPLSSFPGNSTKGWSGYLKINSQTHPVTGELKKIQCPTLVINAMMDILTPWSLSEIILNNIANAEAIVIPGAGHAVNNEKPELLDGLLAGFVNRGKPGKKTVVNALQQNILIRE